MCRRTGWVGWRSVGNQRLNGRPAVSYTADPTAAQRAHGSSSETECGHVVAQTLLRMAGTIQKKAGGDNKKSRRPNDFTKSYFTAL